MADRQAFDKFIQEQATRLRCEDEPPKSVTAWQERKTTLRKKMFEAMGPMPDKACPLMPKIVKVLKRDGYHIENLMFHSRPNVWVSANAYVPTNVKGKVPAVLCVHGHFAGARRDPVIQARCLGLVKLGFFVLAVDAFGAGERYTEPAWGTYHGAFYGSSLWPTGHTLLGMQVYDNRRAVDYLCSREDVESQRLGITGASGGGNQTMYAGALDERFKAVVPVCSVGNYQAYLKAACCVCEVLPGALSFTEEGDVLGLVAPRALMVINATRDAYQFSVEQARKSVARANDIFQLSHVEKKIEHRTFETTHGYHQPMREAMYGWMTKWLNNEGTGKPIAEPKHQVEKPDDLRVWPEAQPKGMLTPITFAAQVGRQLIKKLESETMKHPEDWESAAAYRRSVLKKKILGNFPLRRRPSAKIEKDDTVWLDSEPGITIPLTVKRPEVKGKLPVSVLIDLDGRESAMKHSIVKQLLEKNQHIVAPDLRATGSLKPPRDKIRDTVDHNSTEHSLWLGRPLLGQWVVDVRAILDWLTIQPGVNRNQLSLVGIGTGSIVALVASALLDTQVTSVICLGMTTSYVTKDDYSPEAMQMGLLAPGILKVGDIPQLAALTAPRLLKIVNGLSPIGNMVKRDDLEGKFEYTRNIYRLLKAEKQFQVSQS